MKITRNLPIVASLTAALLAGTAFAQSKTQSATPPVAGVATGVMGVTVEEVVLVAHGWSAKKHLLGKAIYNDRNDKLGRLDDIIMTPDKAQVSYVILDVGGFLGIGAHEVAIPVSQLKIDRDRITLPGATKEIVRAMPEFHYGT